MTPLKALILQTLKNDGPLSDLGLLEMIGDQATGGMAATIVICCLELQTEGFIEQAGNDPNLWQLSNQGLEFVFAVKAPSLPPVAIVGGEQSGVLRRYLVLEISGGDPQTAESWYGLAELEFEHMVDLLKALLPNSAPRARKNPPQVILHRPTAVQA